MKAIKIETVRAVHAPTRGSENAAGMDLYIPAFDGEMRKYFEEKLNNVDVYKDCVGKRSMNDAGYAWLYMLVHANRTYVDECVDLIETYIESIQCDGEGNASVNLSNLPLGTQIFIPSGVKLDIPDGMYVKIDNRSSVAFKMGLSVGANIIDSDYTGEISLNLHASALPSGTLESGMRIAQMILMEHKWNDVRVINGCVCKETERGCGGFGSTGK